MGEKYRPDISLERIKSDGRRLDSQTKMNLINAVLEHFVSLSPEDRSIFLNPGLGLTAGDIEHTLQYATIENKVAAAFSGGFEQRPFEEQENCRQAFLASFCQHLAEFYTKEELDAVINYMQEDVVPVTLHLIGSDHLAVRRIRNAYLPRIVHGANIADGPGDAVTELQKLIN